MFNNLAQYFIYLLFLEKLTTEIAFPEKQKAVQMLIIEELAEIS